MPTKRYIYEFAKEVGMSPRELLQRYTAQEIIDYIALDEIHKEEYSKARAKARAKGKNR